MSSFRLPTLGRKTKLALTVAAALAIVFALFDWNWLRRPLEWYLMHKSKRQVAIGDLHVTLGFGVEPTVRLRNVYVENAPWASKRPMMVAGEALFTFSPTSVWQRRPVISHLRLVDADVDMERQADGLRNWRLLSPEDRSPGIAKVLELEARRTQIRFVNHGIDLDFVAIAADVADGSARGERHDLTSRVVFKGNYQGASFAADAMTGEVLTFRDTGRAFPVRGYMTAGKTRLDFDGSLTDIFDLGPMNVKLRLAGSTLSQVHPFLRIQPPPSRPYALETQLVQANKEYRFLHLRGKVGETDIAGDATYDHRAARPAVTATLRSKAADVVDLAPLVGLRRVASGNARGQGDAQRQAERSERSSRVFPNTPFRTEKLRAVDARLALTAAVLKSAEVPMLESLRVNAELSDGLLEVKSMDLGVAGGFLSGSITFDARSKSPSARAALEVRSVKLEKLFPHLSSKSRSAGTIHGHIRFDGEGSSVAALFSSAKGAFAARMENGSISNLADAKLGLNGGKILSALVRGDRDIAIHCAAVGFKFRSAIGKSETITVDTEQTHVDGTGTIDLREERVDVVLTPQPKKPGFFVRHGSIRLSGPFRNMGVTLQDRVEAGSARNGAGADAELRGASSSQQACGTAR